MAGPPSLFPTTVVGSYPQPAWLVDHSVLRGQVPRVRLPQMWRFEGELLRYAQDDATRLAILDMETAGVDIVTDGEIRRESYGVRFALELDGVDADRPGEILNRLGRPIKAPRIVGPIRRKTAIEVGDAEFLRSHATRATKMTMPGPYTLMRQSRNEFYPDEEALAMAFAEAINEELREIKAAGIDVVQLDEPWMQAWPAGAGDYGLAAIDRAFEGIEGPKVIHVCFGYAHVVKDKGSQYAFLGEFAGTAATHISIEAAQPRLDLGVLRDLSEKSILLGVLDLGAQEIETAETVAGRIEAAFDFVAPERIVAAPDCGMKYLDRDVAFGKLKALADGAALARSRMS